MVDIPIGARVECSDGRGGTCTAIIVSPQTRTVASVVVRDITKYPSLLQVEQARLDRVLDILAGFGGTIEHRPITDDLVRQTLADIESTSVE